MNSEKLLVEQCNLIIADTHFQWRAPWNRIIYVVDKDTFSFSAGNAMTQATDQANESIESKKGCSSCPIKEKCKPKPTMITNYPDQDSISSAIGTEFE